MFGYPTYRIAVHLLPSFLRFGAGALLVLPTTGCVSHGDSFSDQSLFPWSQPEYRVGTVEGVVAVTLRRVETAAIVPYAMAEWLRERNPPASSARVTDSESADDALSVHITDGTNTVRQFRFEVPGLRDMREAGTWCFMEDRGRTLRGEILHIHMRDGDASDSWVERLRGRDGQMVFQYENTTGMRFFAGQRWGESAPLALGMLAQVSSFSS